MGGALGRVQVLSVTEDTLVVRGTHAPVSSEVALETLAPRALVSLADNVAGDDEAGHAVAAFFMMAAGDEAGGRYRLEEAGEYAALVMSAFE